MGSLLFHHLATRGLREVKYPDYGNSKMRVLGNKQTIRKSFHAFTVNSQTNFGWKNKVLRNKFDRTTTTADTAECDKHHRDRNRLSLFFQAFSESGVDKFLLKPSGHHAIKSWHVIIKKKGFWFWPQPPDGWVFWAGEKENAFLEIHLSPKSPVHFGSHHLVRHDRL